MASYHRDCRHSFSCFMLYSCHQCFIFLAHSVVLKSNILLMNSFGILSLIFVFTPVVSSYFYNNKFTHWDHQSSNQISIVMLISAGYMDLIQMQSVLVARLIVVNDRCQSVQC